MEALPNKLILFLFIIGTTNPGTCKFVDAKSKSNDFDDLRVSNNQLGGHLNYQSITPEDETSISQNTNHIGKPLAPSLIEQQQQLQQASLYQIMMQQQLQQQQQQQMQQGAAIGSRPQSQRLSAKKSLGPVRTLNRLAQTETCMWMSLENFKKRTLKPTELIIRDDEEQLCYVLVMTAYLKSSEDNYFLLNNLKALPHASKVKFYNQTTDGSTSEHHSPLNCSAMASSIGINGATSLFLPIQRMPNRSFKEEITIVADCGYLVLNTHVDDSSLTLEGISFYQNPDGSIQLPITELRKSPANWSFGQNRSDYLVFSTDGTENTPLLVIPSLSQYICRNRIRLTGNNSVQLMLDRFELMRLAPYPTTKDSSSSSKSNVKVTKIDLNKIDDDLNHNGRFVARTRRSTEPTQVMHQPQQQLHIVALKNTGTSVVRCSNPANPTEPLLTMVGSNPKKSDDIYGRKVTAERIQSVNSSVSCYFTTLKPVTFIIIYLMIALVQISLSGTKRDFTTYKV